MSADKHLVVMVKAPRAGAVKRRLASEIGAVAAAAFYRRTSARILARLSRDRRWRCWLAVTPDLFAAQGAHWPREISRLSQGAGDLGQRMARLFRITPPGPVVVVGSDIPGLGPDHVARAFAVLKRADMVFGPAEDGGFWLVGARRSLPPGIFKGVRWSSAHALADSLRNLGPQVRVAFADRLSDVDTAADLARWREGAAAGRNL